MLAKSNLPSKALWAVQIFIHRADRPKSAMPRGCHFSVVLNDRRQRHHRHLMRNACASPGKAAASNKIAIDHADDRHFRKDMAKIDAPA